MAILVTSIMQAWICEWFGWWDYRTRNGENSSARLIHVLVCSTWARLQLAPRRASVRRALVAELKFHLRMNPIEGT